MNFERGKSPRESMNVGAEKIAIRVSGISYELHGETIELSDYTTYEFLDRLSKGTLEKDPFRGPQIIEIGVLIGGSDNAEEWEDEDTFRIDQWAGQMLKWEGAYFQMPTFDQLQESGYEHLINMGYRYALYNLEDEQIDEFEKVIKEMKKPIPLLERTVVEEDEQPMASQDIGGLFYADPYTTGWAHKRGLAGYGGKKGTVKEEEKDDPPF